MLDYGSIYQTQGLAAAIQTAVMNNSTLVNTANSVAKAEYDNWQATAKTQLSIFDKSAALTLERAKKQDEQFKKWNDYTAS